MSPRPSRPTAIIGWFAEIYPGVLGRKRKESTHPTSPTTSTNVSRIIATIGTPVQPAAASSRVADGLVVPAERQIVYQHRGVIQRQHISDPASTR